MFIALFLNKFHKYVNEVPVSHFMHVRTGKVDQEQNLIALLQRFMRLVISYPVYAMHKQQRLRSSCKTSYLICGLLLWP